MKGYRGVGQIRRILQFIIEENCKARKQCASQRFRTKKYKHSVVFKNYYMEKTDKHDYVF